MAQLWLFLVMNTCSGGIHRQKIWSPSSATTVLAAPGVLHGKDWLVVSNMSIFNQPVENNNLVDIYFKHIYFQIFNHIWDDVPSWKKNAGLKTTNQRNLWQRKLSLGSGTQSWWNQSSAFFSSLRNVSPFHVLVTTPVHWSCRHHGSCWPVNEPGICPAHANASSGLSRGKRWRPGEVIFLFLALAG